MKVPVFRGFFIGGIMKKGMLLAFGIILFFFVQGTAMAHFGMIVSSDTMVMQEDKRTVHLTLSFSHPFEMVGMPLASPTAVGVMTQGQKSDLSGILKPSRVMGQGAWEMDYKVKKPGVYMFYMEPTPYWEPAEDCYIVHYTKTIVAAYGYDEGWDHEIGLKTEIVPLSKPYGLYAGNVFQGIVKLDGKPVPFAQVEVEYYNQAAKAKAPTDYMVTQSIKADGNGVFTYAAPRAGWWGFAALNEADYKIKHEGVDKDVEIGAVIWVEFHKWQE